MMHFTGGLPETRCGLGSTLAFTEALRPALPELFCGLGTRCLLDAPCGDCNWISKVNLTDVDYIGVDIDPEMIATAIGKDWQYPPASKKFQLLNVLADPLPQADTILCRDFLQHLPMFVIESLLHNFVRSGARWLLTTSHFVEENKSIDKIGGFRPLNLCKPPINFAPPAYELEDGPDRILGVWDMAG